MVRLPGPAEPGSRPRRTLLRGVCTLAIVFSAFSYAAPSAASGAAGVTPDAEATYLRLRELGDAIRTREARGLEATDARLAYPAALAAVREGRGDEWLGNVSAPLAAAQRAAAAMLKTPLKK